MRLERKFYDVFLADTPKPKLIPKPMNGRAPYITAALSKACQTVANAPDGARNSTLNQEAFSLGGLVAHGLSQDDAESELTAAGVMAGLSHSEAAATARGGLKAGMNSPREIPEGKRTGHALDWDSVIGRDTTTAPAAETTQEKPSIMPFELMAPPRGLRTLSLPVRLFALGYAFPLGCASLLHAMGGGGKSMLLLIAFVSACIGRTLVPGWTAAKAGRVLYLALEDDTPEILRRLQRIAFVYELTPSECNMIEDNLRILTPTGGVDFFRRGPGNSIVTGPDFERLRLAIEQHGPFAIVALDPKSALLGGVLDENDNPTAQRVMNLLTALAGPNTAVVIADHVAKTDRENSTSARGGGAWTDAARQAWALRPLTETEKRDAGPGFDSALLVALELRKSNYTAPQKTIYLARRTRTEGAGVLEAIDFEAARQDAAEQASNRVQRAILEVLEGNECTKGELTGKYGTRENLARGTNVRALVGEIADTKVTARSIGIEIETLLAAGLLRQDDAPNMSRKVLKVQP